MKQVKLDSSVNLDCLKKSKFFQDINSVYLESIASSCINISTEKGEVLFIAGENNLAGIFYLISGKVILSSTEDDTDVEKTNEVFKDETFNSLSIFLSLLESIGNLISKKSPATRFTLTFFAPYFLNIGSAVFVINLLFPVIV